jgi:hypothetical protein
VPAIATWLVTRSATMLRSALTMGVETLGVAESLRDDIRMVAEGFVALDRKAESLRRPPA